MNRHIAKPEMCITGIGAVTAVGHDAKTACASIRAGLKRPVKLKNFYVEPKKEYDDWDDGLVSGHPVLEGDPNQTESRLLKLLSMVLQDLYNNAGHDPVIIDNTLLLISIPEAYRTKLSKESLTQAFEESPDEYIFSNNEITTFDNGHAGMIVALTHAVDLISENQCNRVVIAGVDSLIGFDDLNRFNKAKRLKTELNSDGLIPGEGASAILVETITSAQKRGARISARIDQIAIGQEPESLLLGQHSTGDGLLKLLTAISEDKEGDIKPDIILSDLNGEPYRFEELALLMPVGVGKLNGEKTIHYPLRNTGDIGAAYSGIALAIAVQAMSRGYISEKRSTGDALILASSDSGTRGAVYLKPWK